MKLRFRFGAPTGEVADRRAAVEEGKKATALNYWCRKFGDPELDEIVEEHRAWVESRGKSGRKADLAGANFEGADLMGAELQGANLLRASLRGACLIEADMSEANLVSTNLRGASLAGANLVTATGLVARQLAGASLFGAALPESLFPFEGLAKSASVCRILRILLGVMVAMCAFLCVVVKQTKDVALLKNSPAPIPFAAHVAPVLAFYLAGPMLLVGVYIAFHFYLQQLWDALGELPAVFPDGRRLAECVPRSMIVLAPRGLCEMESAGTAFGFLQKLFSKALAYWMVPATLVLLWARYLTEQDWRGSLLQIFFILAASAMSGFLPANETSVFRSSGEIDSGRGNWNSWHVGRFTAVTASSCFLLVIILLGVVLGAPRGKDRAPGLSERDFRRWPAEALGFAGYDPFPKLSGAEISEPPMGWFGQGASEIKTVKGARLQNASLRYAKADRTFFVKSELQGSDLTGADLSEADFRAANLTSANLNAANLSRADFRDADLKNANLTSVVALETKFDGANLYSARLVGARLDRATLSKADLRGAIVEGAELNQADFTGAYLGGAKLAGAQLQSAHLDAAFLDGAELRNADMRSAVFAGTILNDAEFGGANLDGADLRGALGLTAAQVCSARSRSGVLMDEPLRRKVEAACGIAPQD